MIKSYYFSAVDKFDEVGDSLCVGQKIHEDEERVVLFLKMSNGYKFDDSLVKRVKSVIRTELSARHVPAVVLQISDIPVSCIWKLWLSKDIMSLNDPSHAKVDFYSDFRLLAFKNKQTKIIT